MAKPYAEEVQLQTSEPNLAALSKEGCIARYYVAYKITGGATGTGSGKTSRNNS